MQWKSTPGYKVRLESQIAAAQGLDTRTRIRNRSGAHPGRLTEPSFYRKSCENKVSKPVGTVSEGLGERELLEKKTSMAWRSHILTNRLFPLPKPHRFGGDVESLAIGE
uniref:Uncharacterized protein n=1 Tax=Bionectria ochroleuca TaxID=29856 RepID=A0A8H7NPI9_BIOOC